MGLNPFDFVKGICCVIAFAAVWTSDQGNIFDQQEILILPERFRNSADARSGFPAIVANKSIFLAFSYAINGDDHDLAGLAQLDDRFNLYSVIRLAINSIL